MRPVIQGLYLSIAALSLVFSSMVVFAESMKGFGPVNTSQLPLDTGNVVLVSKKFKLCQHPELTASCITLTRSPGSNDGSANHLTLFDEQNNLFYPAQKVFFTLYPNAGLAALAVKQDNGQGWAEITLNPLNASAAQSVPAETAATVWIPVKDWDPTKNLTEQLTDTTGVMLTIQDYMKIFAKAYGAFWLNGVKESQRLMKSSPEDTAKVVPILMCRRMTVKHVRGNWLLVEIVDFDHTAPMGWLRWREENGKILMLPKPPGDTTKHSLILGGSL
jgi:hypothetical protein